MSLERCALRMAGLWLVLALAGSAQAQGYLLGGPGDGGQLAIGTGLGLPIQSLPPLPPGVFPPLLVAPAPGVTIMQDLASPQGGKISFPVSVLSRPAPGAPAALGVFSWNPSVFQVATSIRYAWPAAPAMLSAGGGPGPGVFGTGIAGNVITYSGGTKAFGGAAQFAVTAGPGAGTGRVPPHAGIPPLVSQWINFAAQTPFSVEQVAVVGASNPVGLAQPGASVANVGITTMFGPLIPGEQPWGSVNVPVGGIPCVSKCVSSMGLIASSGPLPSVMVGAVTLFTGLSNMVTISKGYPWTTGLVTVSAPGAIPPEVFFLSGTDMRVAGIGNIQLVSGALSVRALSGPNANRGWLSLTLPEPTAALGLVGALAILGLCHRLALLRSR